MQNDVAYGSKQLSEDDFVEAVEGRRYAIADFRHADHIRLAWIYVRQHGQSKAEERITETIRCFARSHGHEAKYHETQTRAWLRLVATADYLTPTASSFDHFLSTHGWLLRPDALATFYSGTLLSSDQARHGWAEPDRRPLLHTCTVALRHPG